MAELPWFPTWVGEWLSSPAVSMMLPEQEGAFFRLLCLAWGDGSKEPSLPTDATQLATMSKLGARWRKLGHLIVEQFEERNGRLVNARQVASWWEQQEKYAAVVKKASAGGKARAEKLRAASSASGSASGSATGNTQSAAQVVLELSPGTASGSANTESEGAVEPLPPTGQGVLPAPAPGGALAPAGAAPRAADATSNGNGTGTLPRAEVIARLEEMGLPGSTWVESERPASALSRAELTERRKQLELAYRQQLHARADAWFARHPDETGQMEMIERANLLLPAAGEGELKAWQQHALRDAMVDAYRLLPRAHPIPKCDEWVAAREANGAPVAAEADDS